MMLYKYQSALEGTYGSILTEMSQLNEHGLPQAVDALCFIIKPVDLGWYNVALSFIIDNGAILALLQNFHSLHLSFAQTWSSASLSSQSITDY